MQPILYLLIFSLSAVLLLQAVQARPSFLLLLPILLFSFAIGWYLNKQIQKDHEDNLKKGVDYAIEEQDAEHWLHQSFVPKTKLLFQKHIKEAVIYSGIILLLFIFAWSYLVAGLISAFLNVTIAFVLYSIFVYYILHADKWYRFLFQYMPKSVRQYKKNDWVHAYAILLPFALLCFLVYVGFNYTNPFVAMLWGIPVFLFAFTLAFICLYCGNIIYIQYKNDEEKRIENVVKEMTEKKS